MYHHGDLIRIKADNAVAMVDFYSTLTNMIHIFDPLNNHASTAFFLDEIEPVTTETEQ